MRGRFKLGVSMMTDIQAKPYPRFCGECGQERVTPRQLFYNAKIKHDGQLYQFLIEALPIDQCESCGEQWFTLDTDEALQAGLRKHLGLLSPDEIVKRLQELGLSHTAFARRIGVPSETLAHWLSGHAVQNRMMDDLMRRNLDWRVNG